MSTDFFLTATGTDIGKTHVACALLRALGPRGRALKPVASGFDPAHAEDSDPARLLLAMGRKPDPDAIAAICPWRFKAPVSPDLAAAREGAALAFAEVRAWCAARLAEPFDGVTLVEGAGGVMSPIAEDGLALDLIAALGLPALLVTGAYVGAVSHTLTALEALRGRGCAVAAIIVNDHPRDPAGVEDTLRLLRRHGRDLPPLQDLDAAIEALAR